MNEACLSAEELELIKTALQTEYVENRKLADKVAKKIDILLQEPGEEGGFIGVELEDKDGS